MIQRLMSSKKNRIVLIAAACVAAIVIVILLSLNAGKGKTSANENLSKLQEETHQAELAFNNSYGDASIEEKEQFFENLKLFVEQLLGSTKRGRFKELSEIKSMLKAYPDLYDDVIGSYNIYSVLFGVPQSGQDNFDEFIINSRMGQPSSMVLAQFTYNLDPIYYYMEYNGERYHIVIDQSRDGYTDEHAYVEAYGQYLKVEQYDVMGTIIEYAYLTDDEEMTHTEYTVYFMEPVDKEMPDFWEFYISVLTEDDLEKRMLTPNRESKAFESEYDGFADLHPSYADSNPMIDYDGDSILDRVYREYTKEQDQEKVNAYLFLGNGNTVKLSDEVWGARFETYGADVTGDGLKDIVFIQYNNEPNDSRHSFEVFENQNGNYISLYKSSEDYSEIELITDYDGRTEFRTLSEGADGSTENVLYYDGSTFASRQ